MESTPWTVQSCIVRSWARKFRLLNVWLVEEAAFGILLAVCEQT